jgi:hypothetical protein
LVYVEKEAHRSTLSDHVTGHLPQNAVSISLADLSTLALNGSMTARRVQVRIADQVVDWSLTQKSGRSMSIVLIAVDHPSDGDANVFFLVLAGVRGEMAKA